MQCRGIGVAMRRDKEIKKKRKEKRKKERKKEKTKKKAIHVNLK